MNGNILYRSPFRSFEGSRSSKSLSFWLFIVALFTFLGSCQLKVTLRQSFLTFDAWSLSKWPTLSSSQRIFLYNQFHMRSFQIRSLNFILLLQWNGYTAIEAVEHVQAQDSLAHETSFRYIQVKMVFKFCTVCGKTSVRRRNKSIF